MSPGDWWKIALVLVLYPLVMVGTLDAGLKLSGHPTITSAVRRASRQYPAIPFLFGVMFGGLAVHFFT